MRGRHAAGSEAAAADATAVFLTPPQVRLLGRPLHSVLIALFIGALDGVHPQAKHEGRLDDHHGVVDVPSPWLSPLFPLDGSQRSAITEAWVSPRRASLGLVGGGRTAPTARLEVPPLVVLVPLQEPARVGPVVVQLVLLPPLPRLLRHPMRQWVRGLGLQRGMNAGPFRGSQGQGGRASAAGTPHRLGPVPLQGRTELPRPQGWGRWHPGRGVFPGGGHGRPLWLWSGRSGRGCPGRSCLSGPVADVATAAAASAARLYLRLDDELLVPLAGLDGVVVEFLRDSHFQLGMVAEGTDAGLVLLRPHLKVALGAYSGVTALGHVDLAVVEEADGTLLIGPSDAAIETHEAGGQPAVSHEATHGLGIPGSVRIESARLGPAVQLGAGEVERAAPETQEGLRIRLHQPEGVGRGAAPSTGGGGGRGAAPAPAPAPAPAFANAIAALRRPRWLVAHGCCEDRGPMTRTRALDLLTLPPRRGTAGPLPMAAVLGRWLVADVRRRPDVRFQVLYAPPPPNKLRLVLATLASSRCSVRVQYLRVHCCY